MSKMFSECISDSKIILHGQKLFWQIISDKQFTTSILTWPSIEGEHIYLYEPGTTNFQQEGRQDHSQAPNLSAQAELQSTTKDMFFYLYGSWIRSWISCWMQRIQSVSLFKGASIYFCPSILLPGRGAELDGQRRAASCSQQWDSPGLLCLQSLGVHLLLKRVVVDMLMYGAGDL